MCILAVFLPLFQYKHIQKPMISVRLSSLQRTREMFHLRPDELPWQHSCTGAYVSPDETDICRWWKNNRAHQYWWLHTNNGRVSDLSHPMTDTDVPHRDRHLWSQKKRCLVAICSAEGVGMERAGSRFSLITEPVKSFGAPPAAASLSYVSKFCHRGRRTTQNNPHFVTRWFMITVLPWYPRALWCTKLVFFPLFFSPCFCS